MFGIFQNKKWTLSRVCQNRILSLLCMELVGELENITIACSLLVVSVLLVELLIICKVLGSLIVKVC
jgi:hypothetical protein